MKIEQYKRIFLIGASQGIGWELTKQLVADGHYVVIASRQIKSVLSDFASQYADQVTLIDMDVTADPNILRQQCQQAWATYDGLDYWVYNAAIYQKNTLSDDNTELYKQTMDVNFYGFIKLFHILLPYFKNQKSGRWIVNGSISARFGLPLGGAYSASKSALLNTCQSLQPELKMQGIDLQIVNHGFVNTRLTAKNDFDMPFVLSPEIAAKRIKNFMLSPVENFELIFPWQMRFIFSLLNVLPSKWSLALTAKLLPVKKQNQPNSNIYPKKLERENDA